MSLFKKKNEGIKNLHSLNIVNEINQDTKKSMIGRILMGLLIFIVTLICLIFGDAVFALFVLIIALIATHEIIKIPQSFSNEKFKKIVYFFSYFMIISLIFWIFIKNNLAAYFNDKENFILDLSTQFNTPAISLSCLGLSVVFFFIMSMIDKKCKLSDSFFYIVMLLILSLGFQSMLFLRYFPFTENANILMINGQEVNDLMNTSYWTNSENSFKFGQSISLFILLLLGTFGNDTGAYFIGVLFGKHKMSPRISPKKTWEGFIGGVVISASLSIAFLYLLSYFDVPALKLFDYKNTYHMAGNFSIGGWVAHLNIIAISFIMPLTSTIGDLSFSLIKRTYNIKDFGIILKEHGGILDRIDSILFTAVALSFFVVMMEHGWNPLG